MRALYWFRKDLRLQDNQGLHQLASDSKVKEIIPLYIIKKSNNTRCSANRWQFLLESLADLNQQLLKYGSRLVVIKGNAVDIIPQLIRDWKIDILAMERLYEPHGEDRDDRIRCALPAECKIIRAKGQLLFDPTTISKCYGYQKFLSLIEKRTIDQCVNIESIASLPKDLEFSNYWPNLSEFHEDVPTTSIKGGSTEAWVILNEYFKNKSQVANFEKPNTSPAKWNPPSTTLLSPYLVWGAISCRQFFHEIKAILNSSGKHSEPPVSLLGQLYWREFFHFQGRIVENFETMNGNPRCKQIPWRSGLTENDGLNDLVKWKNGETGFPWIDALMRQLKQTGWMHHLGRHSVACFLTRGDLFIHWERGKEHFQEYLLDHDWSLNTGNWLWLSASCYFYQFYRVYGPTSFPGKYKESMEFIKSFVPELKNVPKKYIFEPWKMSIQEQKRFNCIIGTDYPYPIGNHREMSDRCIASMKSAYEANKIGLNILGKRQWDQQ